MDGIMVQIRPPELKDAPLRGASSAVFSALSLPLHISSVSPAGGAANLHHQTDLKLAPLCLQQDNS